jgi:hypothetical protein
LYHKRQSLSQKGAKKPQERVLSGAGRSGFILQPSQQPPRRSAPSSVYPPPEPGAPCPEHPVLRPWKEDAQFFSDFVPELLKITQFYHFFMLK